MTLPTNHGGTLIEPNPRVSFPESFLTQTVPQLSDLAELQVSLAIFRLVEGLGGDDTPLARPVIYRDRPLRAALRVEGSPREPDASIARGLDLAVGRGTILQFAALHPAEQATWYYVNTAANAHQVSAMVRGAIPPPRTLWQEETPPSIQAARPNVFRLYEQNIGPLTPLVADKLIDALETFPEDWINDAIGEAVSYNKRNWRYIYRILENWSAAGRGQPATLTRGTER